MPNYYPHIPCDKKYLDRQAISIWHDKFSGWCGYLECNLEVLTPLCINTWTNPVFIQGSTIKGMIRSVAEIVSQSCFRTDERASSPFESCTKGNEACTCCRLFGGSFKDDKEIVSYQSKIFFEDTKYIPTDKLEHKRMLVGHQIYDRYADGRRVFPYSHPGFVDNSEYPALVAIEGTIFKFGTYCENLDNDELGLLLYSLELEPNMAHKLGYMKSRGLGSVRIKITKMALTNEPAKGFLQFDPLQYVTDLTEIERYKNQYLQNKNLGNSAHLQKFRNLMEYGG
jgi:CRISPR/Cas system CSM-associated protein Csm3 (group 7 of RAMP superfamily)